jgi:hypothetical protein
MTSAVRRNGQVDGCRSSVPLGGLAGSESRRAGGRSGAAGLLFGSMALHRGMVPLNITIEPTSYPGEETGDAFLDLTIFSPGGIDEDRLRANLVAMTGVTDGFVLTEHRRWTEWGASSEAYELVLTIASHAWAGIIGGAAWDLLKRTVQSLGHAATSLSHVPDDADVHHEARYRVAMRYDGVEVDDLEVLETSMATDSDGFEWSVTLRAPTGTEYVVTRKGTDSFAMTRTERRR